jgi:PAS domain S-box-containing protein
MTKAENDAFKLQSIIDCSRLGTWEWNVQSGETVFNETWAQIIGYSLDELAPISIKSWEALAHPDDMKKSSKLLERHFSGELPYYEIECRMKHKDGHWVWVRDRGKVVSWSADGKPLMMFGTHADITERKQAEQSLKESELKYRSFIEASSDAIFCVDEKGQYQFTNRLFASTFGKSPDYFIGKTFWDIYPKEHADYRFEATKRVFQTGESESLEVEVPLPDKTLFFYATANPIKDETGKVILALTHAVNITERKHIEDELRESEKKFSAAFHHGPQMMAISDIKTGRYLEVNDNFIRLTGFSRKEAIDKKSTDLGILSKDDRQTLIRELQQTGRIAGKEMTMYRKNGEPFWCLFFAEIIQVSGTDHILWLVEDITDRKRAEEALLDSQQKFQALVESTSDFIWEMDSRGLYTYCSPQLDILWGFHPAEMLGKSPFDLLPPEDREQAIKGFSALAESASPFRNMEMRSVDGTGQVKLIEISGAPFFDMEGKLSGYRGITRDITERKQIEEELQKAQKLESLGVLAGGIAHDFNNLMGGIFGYIDMASEASTENKVTSYLSKAMNTIDRARALTQQLLTFAKGGAPVQQIGDLFPFVQETAQFALSGANISCHFDVPQDLWACNFDKNQIGQVIDNLIINAQQAMPVGGTIELSSRNITLAEKEHPLLANGNYVKISVKDSGVGIPKELISKIFDPFFTTKAKGHGLGLATCYSIIKHHGGCIDVESEPGKGSTFKVYLPASTEAASSAIKQTDKTHKGTGTFLIMDDEEVMRDTIGDMLETLGYTVISKENGKDAIDFFATEIKANRKIVGMIFDLTVPGGMGGKAAIEEIRKIDTEIPAFVASGYADDPVMKKPAEHGFTASICKPFIKSELSEMLNNYLKPKK